MTAKALPAVETAAEWQALAGLAGRVGARHLRELFAEDPGRGRQFVAEACGLYFDFSKQRIDRETLDQLFQLANARGLQARIDALFAGEPVNRSERRPALHMALRAGIGGDFRVAGRAVGSDVQAVLARMQAFAERVRSGDWRGHSGRAIRNVVNIGIGGSDLGPVMAFEALRHYSRPGLAPRFVSNVDGSDFVEATRDLDPAETLFIVCSKTFTTEETLRNAAAARAWCLARLSDPAAIARHFVAVSTNADAVAEFGIDPANMFEFWDWVGGRYSMTSAIGLSTLIAIGSEHFLALLAGFADMDQHFRSAGFAANLPVLHGLLALWNSNFLGAESCVVLPYEHYLHRFPAYLQQLTMESLGKRVRQDGSPLGVHSGPLYWGEPGTNGQHSFYQLLHQGTRAFSCDFIGFAQTLNPLADQHDLLIANLLAQSRALAFGKSADQVRADGVPTALVPHRTFPGNHQSSTLLAERLTPHSLGALVALYEHSVLVQAAVLDINPFDQWGVELGKRLARELAEQIAGSAAAGAGQDSSTNALLERYRAWRRPPA